MERGTIVTFSDELWGAVLSGVKRSLFGQLVHNREFGWSFDLGTSVLYPHDSVFVVLGVEDPVGCGPDERVVWVPAPGGRRLGAWRRNLREITS